MDYDPTVHDDERNPLRVFDLPEHVLHALRARYSGGWVRRWHQPAPDVLVGALWSRSWASVLRVSVERACEACGGSGRGDSLPDPAPDAPYGRVVWRPCGACLGSGLVAGAPGSVADAPTCPSCRADQGRRARAAIAAAYGHHREAGES